MNYSQEKQIIDEDKLLFQVYEESMPELEYH